MNYSEREPLAGFQSNFKLSIKFLKMLLAC